MSKLMESVFIRAKSLNKHIVLAEGEELRIINAAKEIVKRNIARITLIGDPKIIEKKAGKLDNINIINPCTSENTAKYIGILYEARKSKGLTLEQAQKLTLNPLYYATLMLKSGDADGMVAGSVNSTGDVMRPALQIIKTTPGVNTVSSCFIMSMPEDGPGFKYGQDGVLVFGDCAVMPNPNANQLADIAVASANSAKIIANIDPKVAMLSFSTKGSAKHEFVDKVCEATKIVKEQAPELVCDGELQADAALVASIGTLKAPGSCVAGQANVLIFPDLQSGNISYKLVQRLAGAEAVGPICQGLAKPVNDLSRGCSVEDVVGVVAITTLQCN
ncbi:MAG TPA: phosphate acetyltransferase [Clostridia bacterium]|nr:phosphate acetyltransferase [Clostridia bacterium]